MIYVGIYIITDMVMSLRSIMFKMYELNKMLSRANMYTVYNTLNKSIFHYNVLT